MGIKVNYIQGCKVGNCILIRELEGEFRFRTAEFKCNCGNIFIALIQNVKRGLTKSCGCALINSKGNYKHGYTPKNGSNSVYVIYHQMVSRCYKEKDKNYVRYGARGIKVCDRWLNDFSNFIEDMGDRPSKLYSLDRIDNNGSYSKGNCRWATRTEQNRNTRRNNYITYLGKTQCLSQWCEELNLNYKAISLRIVRRKWPIEKAFTTPIKKP